MRAKKPATTFASYLGSQLKDPEVRFHFEQRRLVHEVAIAVRSMRQGAGLTQSELATRIGASQPMIARIEKGLDQRRPRFETLHKVALALGRQLKLSFTQSDETAERSFVEVDGTPARELETQPEA
jgi:transcriptional regulator with XRE-family HTH domain